MFGGLGKAISKAGKQASQNAKNLPKAVQTAAGAGGAVISAPAQVALSAAGQTLTAAAPVIKQASGIIADNPALAGLAGSLLGMPGLGGLFGGSGAPTDATGYPAQGSSSTWLWWVLGLGAAALGLFLILRRKS